MGSVCVCVGGGGGGAGVSFCYKSTTPQNRLCPLKKLALNINVLSTAYDSLGTL